MEVTGMRLLRLAGTVVLLGSAFTAAPAHAEGGTSAACSIAFPIHFSPGLSMTTGSGSYGSGGETGSITCTGTVHGHRITGPGTFGFEGTYTEGNCLAHKGTGSSFLTIPTDAGPVRVDGGSFSDQGLGLTGSSKARHTGGIRFSGTYIVLPVQGDCLVSPITSGQASMTGQMSG
jgi:hypothetical protein